MNLAILGVHALEGGYNESSSLSCAVLCTRQDIAAGQSNWYGLFLDRGGLLETSLEYAHHEFALDEEFLEVESLGGGDILSRHVSLDGLERPVFAWKRGRKPRSVVVHPWDEQQVRLSSFRLLVSPMMIAHCVLC